MAHSRLWRHARHSINVPGLSRGVVTMLDLLLYLITGLDQCGPESQPGLAPGREATHNLTRRLSRAGMPFLMHLLLQLSAITWLPWLVFSKVSLSRICLGPNRLWKKTQLPQVINEAKGLTTRQVLATKWGLQPPETPRRQCWIPVQIQQIPPT